LVLALVGLEALFDFVAPDQLGAALADAPIGVAASGHLHGHQVRIRGTRIRGGLGQSHRNRDDSVQGQSEEHEGCQQKEDDIDQRNDLDAGLFLAAFCGFA